MATKKSFKETHSFEKRSLESARVKQKYPDRVPVIVERADNTDVPDIDKSKFLIPVDLTVGQFVYVIRKRIKLTEDQALFIFVNNTLPSSQSLMSTVFTEHGEDDGFLYFRYSGESTFGMGV